MRLHQSIRICVSKFNANSQLNNMKKFEWKQIGFYFGLFFFCVCRLEQSNEFKISIKTDDKPEHAKFKLKFDLFRCNEMMKW